MRDSLPPPRLHNPLPPLFPPCNTGLGLKAVWHGAEALGNVIGAQQQLAGGSKRSSGGSGAAAAASGTLTREQAIAAIKQDYNSNYFVSGMKAASCSRKTPPTPC